MLEIPSVPADLSPKVEDFLPVCE